MRPAGILLIAEFDRLPQQATNSADPSGARAARPYFVVFVFPFVTFVVVICL